MGKWLMLLVMSVLLLADLATLHRSGRRTLVSDIIWWTGKGLAGAYYALTIWAYLRRGPALATGGSAISHVVAVSATWLPFTLPLLASGTPGLATGYVGTTLMLAGTALAVWSLHSLGSYLSILAQARGVAESGPYRWLRHPLYAGELATLLGLALSLGGPGPLAGWLLLCCLEAYRATQEERILMRALPGYAVYRSRTAAILPGIF